MQGVIKKIVEERGFGFIKRQDNGKSVFFHCSDIQCEWPPDLESKVDFEVTETDKGTRAVNINLL